MRCLILITCVMALMVAGGCAGTGALKATTPAQANIVKQTVDGLVQIDKDLTDAGKKLSLQWARSWAWQGPVIRGYIELRLWDAPAPAISCMTMLDGIIKAAQDRQPGVENDKLTFTDKELGGVFYAKTTLTAANMLAIINRIAPQAGQALLTVFGGSLM